MWNRPESPERNGTQMVASREDGLAFWRGLGLALILGIFAWGLIAYSLYQLWRSLK